MGAATARLGSEWHCRRGFESHRPLARSQLGPSDCADGRSRPHRSDGRRGCDDGRRSAASTGNDPSDDCRIRARRGNRLRRAAAAQRRRPLQTSGVERLQCLDVMVDECRGVRRRRGFPSDVAKCRRGVEGHARDAQVPGGMVPWLGFQSAVVQYEQAPRYAGMPAYTWRRSLRLAHHGLFSFSTLPLNLITWLGFFFAAAAGAYLVYVAFVAFYGRTVTGWTSVIGVMLIVSAFQFLAMSIMAQYGDDVRGDEAPAALRAEAGTDRLARTPGRSSGRPGRLGAAATRMTRGEALPQLGSTARRSRVHLASELCVRAAGLTGNRLLHGRRLHRRRQARRARSHQYD